MSAMIDVCNMLATGAVHLLPRVYQNCSYLNASKTTNAVNIRTTATLKSTLVTTAVGGDRKICFNMLRFYLYYFASADMAAPGAATDGTTATTVNSSTAYQIPGKLRSIIPSVYSSVFEAYFARFVPITTSNAFPHYVDTFFLDTCIELWIRTSWVAAGQKLSMEHMHSISVFVSSIVKHNLQQCFANQESLYYAVYASVKDELVYMLSRLAHNWSKSDDYLQVMELWAVWAAPWRMGATPRTAEKEVYSPVKRGWAPFILDNLPFYFSIVNIVLQRTATFEDKDSIQPATAPLTSFTDTGAIRGQLRILYRLINVLRAEGLVEFLGLIERGVWSVCSQAPSA